MSSTVYNHRSLQPTGAPPQAQAVVLQHSSARLADSLEVIRQEFEALSQDASLARSQRDELENNVSGQVNELNIIRQSLYELEQSHSKIRQQYEEELARLRQDLHAARQGHLPAPASHTTPSSAMSAPLPVGIPPQATPSDRQAPYSDPYFGRDRDRERDRERERERDRERDGRESKRIKSERSKPERDRQDPYAGGTPTKLPPPNYPNDGPSSQQSAALVPSGSAQYPEEGTPTDYNSTRKDGTDWFADYPPKSSKRSIDVQLVHTLQHESVVCCVRFSADGKYVATGCNRSAQIYDTKTGAKVCVLVDEGASKTGDLYIRSVCYSPDGRYLATGAEDKQIRIWEIAKKKIRTIFEGHQQEIYSLDFSRDGRMIVSGSGDKTARIWDMHTKECKILSINEPDSVDAGVTSVAISRDSRLVAAGSLDTVVRIWDVQTGHLIERLNGHRDSVYSVAFTPDGMGLVSGSLDKTLKHWDVSPLLRGGGARNTPLQQGGIPSGVANGKKEGGEKGSTCTQNFIGHKDYVLSVAVSHDGKWVVSGSKDRCVQFWDARTAQMQLMLQGHKNSVISIDLSPSNNLLATGSGDCQARLWNFTTL